jgi:transcriptional regulator with XRE-family HTH domain
MTRHLACPMLRAAATIVRHHRADTFPAHCLECPWWDGRFGECRVRLVTMAPAGELLINALNSYGLADGQVAGLLGVNKSTVSRWHSGLDRIPEARARQLYGLLERLKAGDQGLDKDIAENRAYLRQEKARYVRRLLADLNGYGYRNADIARFFDVNRSVVWTWKRGIRVPNAERLKALEELLEEAAERHRRFMQSIGEGP